MNTSPPPENKGERLAKRIARSGLCSRREAEQWIEAGIVKVNGKVVESPALNVTDQDKIIVDGQTLGAKENTRVWLFHKPTGCVTTHKDTHGRPTVFDLLPKTLGRVISVGRLDMNSEGLLLLTNDGDLARKLELPSNGWIRKYRVRVYGRISQDILSEMKKGVVANGVHYGSAEASIDSQQGGNTWLTVSLTEGKNREIRHIFEHFGCKVNRLIRISYGPFQLGKLPRGEIKDVPENVLKSFIKL